MRYEYRCEASGETFTRQRPMAESREDAECLCGARGARIISKPMMTIAHPDLNYECPATGEIVTSWSKRKNTFAEHDLVDARERNAEFRKKRKARMAERAMREAEGLPAKEVQTEQKRLEKMVHEAREDSRHY